MQLHVPSSSGGQRRLLNLRDLLTGLYLAGDGHYHQPEERLHADVRFELQAAVDRYKSAPHKDLSPDTEKALRCLELYWGLYQGQELPSTPRTQRDVADAMGVSRGTVGRWVKLALELLVRDLDHDVRRASVLTSCGRGASPTPPS